jgi:GT2 family glycosyltransferase
MKLTDFSIIIPNLNGAKLLSDCLNSLIPAIKNTPNSKFEIILVDNASTDNSLNLAKKIYPQIKIIKNLKNRGFAQAVNQGILSAKYPWIVPCNNDIKLDKNWFKLISQTINKHPKVITFFGTVLDKTGAKIESVGLRFNYSGQCQNLENGQLFNPSLLKEKAKLIWGANASLVVYKKDIISKIGMFDPDFFAYEEDVDLALRLHNLNYQTLWIPRALSYHLGGATSSQMGNFRNRHDAQNWIYLIVKNYSAKQLWQNLPGLLEQRLRNLSGLLKNTPFLLWLPTLISVYGQVIFKLPSMLKKRCQKN